MSAQRSKPKLLEGDELWRYALKTLGGRAYSSSELRQKLRRKAVPGQDLDALLARLREYGYLNDQRFAENFATGRLENQGFGKARILRDLRQRRVAPGVAEQAVQKTFSDVDETALIEDYLRRKYRNRPLNEFLSDPKNLASVYRRLRYAGFTSGNSIRILKRFASEPDVLDWLDGESPSSDS